MSILLRDLIDIPERAGAEDYVLRLTEGVSGSHVHDTVSDYVVTDALAGAFDQALDLVTAALRDGQSRAAFLQGSFGSGKSHFMAVLYALLGHDATARAKPEFAPVISRHDGVLSGKKILRLAYHFLGAETTEEVILGGYVQQIRALHPNCVLPPVHRTDGLLANADQIRDQMTDEPFFAGLNRQGSGSTDGDDLWDRVVTGSWDASSYAAARSAAHGSPQRTALVSALVSAYLSSHAESGDYVSLDGGLAAITEHAKSLGYDAVVLFLDELVLWLAFRVREQAFFGREAQKITKLVESGSGSRAIPLVSFVARQMDLRRYFVESGRGVGSEQEALDQAFSHQQGRFATIVLGDDNLPFVAEKRLLAPRDERSRAVIDSAFDSLDRRADVWDVLLDGVNTDETHRGANQAAFRRTYPFSPALVSTLRTLASAMQRDRTALKVMQRLLVRGRDTLTVDDVIPVGDVFDDVVEGNQAVTPEMEGRIKNARRLYREKLRPVLLRENLLADSDVSGLPAGHAFFADDRLAKTLILSAVAPDVPALRDLTPSRLAALNHGSITSPLPGQEASVALTKIKRWSVDVPEIQVSGDARNPTILVQISEVEYESIVRKASGEDNSGRRREQLKRLVWEALALDDVADDAFGVQRQRRIWRGSQREVEVVFGNIRDRQWLPDAVFEAGPNTWRFVIDYPFDEDGRSAADDARRLDELKSTDLNTRTVAWDPHFLSRQMQDDLGRLVVLEWLLSGPGERWASHANHLAEPERVQARAILETQQRALRDRLRRAVQEAYGAATPTVGTIDIDPGHDRVLTSLDRAFDPAAPVGHDLAAAFTNLIDQAFSSTFPAHPDFAPSDREVRIADLTATLDAIEHAQQDPDGRYVVEPAKRDTVRRIANALKVGYMGENAFLFGADRFPWAMQFSRAMGRDGLASDDPVTVGRLHGWIGELDPAYGLRAEVADLIICAWAILENRAWYRHGSLFQSPKPGTLPPDVELRPERLPAAADWSRAVSRAGALFGFTGNSYLTGAATAELVDAVARSAAELRGPATALVEQLATVYRQLGLPTDNPTGRLATAQAARDLLTSLQSTGDRVAFIERLATADLPSTDQSVGRSLRTASDIARIAASFSWDRLGPLRTVEHGFDDRGRTAKAILDRLRESAAYDELTQSLREALQRAEADAYGWVVAGTVTAPPAPVSVVDDPARRTAGGRATIAPGSSPAVILDALTEFIADNPGRTISVEWLADQ